MLQTLVMKSSCRSCCAKDMSCPNGSWRRDSSRCYHFHPTLLPNINSSHGNTVLNAFIAIFCHNPRTQVVSPATRDGYWSISSTIWFDRVLFWWSDPSSISHWHNPYVFFLDAVDAVGRILLATTQPPKLDPIRASISTKSTQGECASSESLSLVRRCNVHILMSSRVDTIFGDMWRELQ